MCYYLRANNLSTRNIAVGVSFQILMGGSQVLLSLSRSGVCLHSLGMETIASTRMQGKGKHNAEQEVMDDRKHEARGL